jgi:NADH:ubiquinone oxidoreductase subunit 6 (subunit J)
MKMFMVFMFVLGAILLSSSIIINDQLAGKKCGEKARKYNSGIIILGTTLIVLSITTFVCESKCKQFDNDQEESEYLDVYIGVVSMIAIIVFILSLMILLDLKDSECANPKKIAMIQVITSSAVIVIIMGMGFIKIYDQKKETTSSGKRTADLPPIPSWE